MEVLRHTKRQEHLHFILILPDGTKSLVPADWTDFAASSTLQTPDGTLAGSLEDLLQLRRHPFDSRRVMAQLNLNFIDIPIPETCLWEELDGEQKQLVVEMLARLMIKAARTGHPQEPAHD